MKLKTNAVEEKYMIERDGAKCRTLNLDPGYLNASRLILATAKDFSHRIYLGKGIYAEITLNFGKTGIATLPWTYPDFKTAEYQAFVIKIREAYLQQQ